MTTAQQPQFDPIKSAWSGAFFGAVWGATFGYIGHAATRGTRDFSSSQRLAASKYDVAARGGHAPDARRLLGINA